MLMPLVLGPPLKTTLLEKVIEKGQMINRQWKASVKARGPLFSLTKRLHRGSTTEGKKWLDSGLIERQTLEKENTQPRQAGN